MLPRNSFLCFAAFVFLHPFESSGFIYEDYYWKDYEGNIPDEALVGGQDASGKPIYIGQAYYYSKLLPAQIYENDPSAYLAWGTEIKVSEHIKILCTPHPEKFQWVPTRKDKIHTLVNNMFVKGGTDKYYDLYIGRAFYKLQTLIGYNKVDGRPSKNLGLHITADGSQTVVDDFEILTYTPKQTVTEKIITIGKVLV